MEKKLSEEVIKIIRNDIPLRKKIAVQMGIEPSSVYDYASRPKKESRLTKLPIVIEVIKKHTGLKDKEIFKTDSMVYKLASNN